MAKTTSRLGNLNVLAHVPRFIVKLKRDAHVQGIDCRISA